MCKGFLLRLPHRPPEAAGVEDRNIILSRRVSGVGTRDNRVNPGLSSALGSERKAATASHLPHRLPLAGGGGLALEDPKALPSFRGVCS